MEPKGGRRYLNAINLHLMKTKTGPFRILPTVVLGASLAVLTYTSGCLAVAVGAAGAGTAVAYVRGDLNAVLTANLDASHRAVLQAISQLQFAKVSENKDALQSIVVARNAADKKVEFRLEKMVDDSTKLKIRVGTFGDEALSQTILEKVKASL
jgi:hypothetical protein